MKKIELTWIDNFFKNIKDHIFVRAQDRVLILPPNKVYKLNSTGLLLIQKLLQGKKIKNIRSINNNSKALEVHNFFCDLRALIRGCPEYPTQRRAVVTTPYDFNFTELPILGEIAVTYRCNNNCSFCYVGSRDFRKQIKEMSLRQIKRVIKIFKQRARIPFFSFTGGEPLLRDDLPQMIAYATKLGLRVNLITNGTLVNSKIAKSLYKSGLRTAQVSIESHDQDIHDELTGVSGSWRKTLAGIKCLQENGIAVQTNTTLNRINAATINFLPPFLTSLNINKFSMNLYIPVGQGLCHKDLFFPYSETGAIIDMIKKQARKNNLTFYWYSPIPHCYYNPIASGLGNKSCAAMDGLLSVAPNGDVLPCSSYRTPLGNILTQDFMSIWFSSRAMYFKNKRFSPKECRGCDKFIACQSACPLYWQYAGTNELKKVTREECVNII